VLKREGDGKRLKVGWRARTSAHTKKGKEALFPGDAYCKALSIVDFRIREITDTI
jgi:hypothetical protein